MIGVVAALLLAWNGADDDAPKVRYYELDVAAPGHESIAPIPERDLAATLADRGFTGVVLWFAPDDPRASGLPEEPAARQLQPGASTSPELAAVADPFSAWRLAVAAGRRSLTGVYVRPNLLLGTRITIERSPAAEGRPADELQLDRATRPGVRGWLWCDPERASDSLSRLSVSSRLVEPTSPALRAEQTRLDLNAFGTKPGPVAPALLLQSRIASRVAGHLSHIEMQRVFPFENEALLEPPAPAVPIEPLRRGAPQLDLEEWCFSEPGMASPVEMVLHGLKRPWISESDLALAADAKSGTVPLIGVLDPDETLLFAEVVNARVVAMEAYLAFMAHGDTGQRDRLQLALGDQSTRIAQLTRLREGWRATFALDRDVVDRAEPWRLRTTRWSAKRGGTDEAAHDVTLTRADDPRLGEWAPKIEQALGGRDLDLWKFFPVKAGLEVTLRTPIALRDPRNVRLRIDAAATRSVRVNGVVAIEALAGARGPLLATLPLPAGSSSIEVVLTLDGADGRVGLELDLLPNRVEGILLDPDRASRVNEPAVRLHDPTALGQTCLVRPAGRTIGTTGGNPADRFGSATLPFPLANPTRFDVWVHVLPLSDRASTLALGFDDGATQEVVLAPASSWIWVRAPAPATLAAADHALRILFPTENVRVDQAVLFASELVFPRAPDGRTSIAASAWRFDPLGSGIVLDLPQLRLGEYFGRSFSLDKGGTYDVFVWLKGSDPLAPGQWAELDLSSPSGRQRFVLPAGTPYEEWVALGSVSFAPDERIELKAQGQGALARVTLIR